MMKATTKVGIKVTAGLKAGGAMNHNRRVLAVRAGLKAAGYSNHNRLLSALG
jgi:hypothetical protein